MKSKSRMQELNTIIKVISLPLIVVEVTYNGTKWKPKNFPELLIMLNLEKQQIINDIVVEVSKHA